VDGEDALGVDRVGMRAELSDDADPGAGAVAVAVAVAVVVATTGTGAAASLVSKASVVANSC
jgi:hypothetical protein